MHELLTPEESALADRTAIGMGIPIATLMDNAGRAVARAIRARIRPCRTLVLCGPGNNGGDGQVAARYLADAGWPVRVLTLDAFSPEEAACADLVIDAAFGAGLSRELSPQVIATLKAARRIVAIDVPSGLDGATGLPRPWAPRAELTVTFFRLKPGHLLLPGRELCGEVVLADILLPAAVLDTLRPQTWRNHPDLWTLPVPGASAHKYSRGHVTVLGGASMTGAARLAAMAARRAGAGLVTIAAQGSADIYRAGAPGVMVDASPMVRQLDDPRHNAWVAGPGLGLQTAEVLLPPLLAAGRLVVVDADGLSAFAGQPERLRGATVLTPHMGEFTRLFGAPGDDRISAVRAAATRAGAVVLLKGADTIVAAPDGRAVVNDSAPPWLATAGAGDVLAGLIAALLGQGLEPFAAACAGAWLHGRAAAIAGQGLIAEDLPPAFARAFADAAR